jgi:DNA-binding NtrC family response regulator
LRERSEDIGLLAWHFLKRYARELGRPVKGFNEKVLPLLEHHSWPGNVRELQNAIKRSVLFCRGEQLLPEDLPASLRTEQDNVAPLLPQTGFDKSLPERREEIQGS